MLLILDVDSESMVAAISEMRRDLETICRGVALEQQ